MKLLVTGASGFLGARLCSVLQRTKPHITVRAATRRDMPTPSSGNIDWLRVQGLEDAVDWSAALQGIDTVVHLAARVHVMREDHCDALAAYRRVNVQGTLSLANQAARAGVRRFVFMSSVKVHGDSTDGSRRYDEDSPALPLDAYGISKLEAERGLQAAAGGMEVVVIRPPLIYGPGVKANFATLMRAVQRGFPLPLGAIDNRRSLVALDNLVDFVATCIEHPSAANQSFLVSDDEDLSTPELVRRLARAMHRPARLFPLPPRLLLGMAALFDRREAATRLCGSLQVDTTKARTLLGWSQPIAVDEGLRRAVADMEGA